MSYYEFPAGSENQIETNPETGEDWIFKNGAWEKLASSEFDSDLLEQHWEALEFRYVPLVGPADQTQGLTIADSLQINQQKIRFGDENVLQMLAGDISNFTEYTAGKDAGVQHTADIAYANGTYVTSGGNWDKSVNIGRVNGIEEGDWTVTTSISGLNSRGNFYGVGTNGSGTWVACGYKKSLAYSSDDGLTWNNNAGITGSGGWSTSDYIFDVHWDGSQFIVGGSGGKIATSADGASWTMVSKTGTAVTGNIKSIFYSPEGRYILGSTAGLWYTEPGAPVTGPYTKHPQSFGPIYSIKYHPVRGLYYLAGDGGKISRTTVANDLSGQWESGVVMDGKDIRGMELNQYNHIVVCGFEGKASSSVDGGDTWTDIETGTNERLYGAVWDNDDKRWVFAGGSKLFTNLVATSESIYLNESRLLTELDSAIIKQIVGETDIDGFVSIDGDSMTGNLSVPDPINNRDAANAQWVEAITDDLEDRKVNKSGDSMTGPLILTVEPTEALHAANKVYVDQKVFDALNGADSALDSTALRDIFVAVEGDSMIGDLSVPNLIASGDVSAANINADDLVTITTGELSADSAGGDDEFTPTILPVNGTTISSPYGVDQSPDGQTIIYNGSDGGIRLSKDGGETFAATPSVPSGRLYTAWAQDGGKLWSSASSSTYVSLDDGATWTKSNPTNSGHNIVIFHSASWDPDVFITVANDTWVQYTNDGGTTWQGGTGIQPNGASVRPAAVADDGNKIYVLSENGKVSCWDGVGAWEYGEFIQGEAGWASNQIRNILFANGKWWAIDKNHLWVGGASMWDTFTKTPCDNGTTNTNAGKALVQIGDAIVFDQNGYYWVTTDEGQTVREAFQQTAGAAGNKGLAWNDKYVFTAPKTAGSSPLLRGLLPQAEDQGLYWNGDKLATTEQLKAGIEGILDVLGEKDSIQEIDLRAYLKRSGDSMTGALQLFGDPTESMHAVTKQYVDSAVNNLDSAVNNLTFDSDTIHGLITDVIDSNDLVHIAGDSMTGFLTLHANPVNNMHAATKAYVTAAIIDAVDSATGSITVDSDMILNTFVEVAGDSMQGLLKLSADPTDPLHAATKQYVDMQDSATKQYVDMQDSLHDVDMKDYVDNTINSEINDVLNTLGDYKLKSDSDALNDLSNVSVPSPSIGDRLVWNGSQWEAETPVAPDPAVAYQDLPPANPTNGDLWFNTTNLKLSIWHANAWVQVGA